MKRFGLKLRAKILLFASFLLVIPYLSYQYVVELESYLQIGQEQALVGTARAVATALHERPALFDVKSGFLHNVVAGKDLFIHEIAYPVQLDGRLDDWTEYKDKWLDYGANSLIEQSIVYQPESLQFTHMVGRYEQYVYAIFDVIDDSVLFRPQTSLRVDRNDFLQIAMLTNDGLFKRYLIAPYEPGWVNAYLLDEDVDRLTPVSLETKIQGQWRITPEGYSIELRFPAAMLSSNIAFAIGDVDDPETRRLNYLIGTANPTRSEALGTVLTPAPEIDKILAGLSYSDSRIWVVDNNMRVLATAGDINTATGFQVESNRQTGKNFWGDLYQQFLQPLYQKILTEPPQTFVDDLQDAVSLEGQDIQSALTGKADTLWRFTPDKKAVILSAAHPIYNQGEVMGAVVVEQTTNGIRTLRNQALEKQFNFILAVILIGILALLLLASRISNRIRKLRDDTESAIDQSGKIVGQIPLSNSADEIGDLSRTFHQVLEKLKQYNSYLENMASRLSHELRTPVAVVNSSLDNIALDPDNQAVYVERAKQGISRLSKILNNMSEATRLEEAIKGTDKEKFDLPGLLKSCVEGYGMTHPDYHFQLDLDVTEKTFVGAPDLFAQMLDKIVTNAMEFSKPSDTIRLRVFEKGSKTCISVTNTGPLLPDKMRSQLMNSMISVRPNTTSESSHLGLGLFMANIIAQFHNGSIDIDNLPDHSGVIVLLKF
ncbi:proteobacterial dedicated sortase system histidine kinase [Glaciecola sp. 1036]|uniref:proteobacterial dedicated sortase system histidine kinase n=1 Tax=Alteromonadaceae TaxID=72275 RepID=UPI003D07088B